VIGLPPAGDTPEYRALVAAHDCYLRDIHGELLSKVNPAGDVGQFVPWALLHHVVQLGRPVQASVQLGYSDEAIPATRAMVSATANLCFIARSGNPAGWALVYWFQLEDFERRLLALDEVRARFDPATLKTRADETTAAVTGARAAAEEAGIVVPDKLPSASRGGKPRRDTWTGLSDRELFDRGGMLAAYRTDYGYSSTMTHAQAVAIQPTVHSLIDGHLPSVGPHFRPPLPALTTSFNALKYAGDAAIEHFALASARPALDTANAAMSDAIERYREDTGINAMVAQVLGSPAEDG